MNTDFLSLKILKKTFKNFKMIIWFFIGAFILALVKDFVIPFFIDEREGNATAKDKEERKLNGLDLI